MVIITNDIALQSAQRELSALLMQSPSINAVRIKEIQDAIHKYLAGKK